MSSPSRRSAAPASYLPLAGPLALAAVLNTRRLLQNGWGNNFYSAGVSSMLQSLHNFLFLSSDPGGLISIDKPPLGLWLQVLSAKIFGFSPASLLYPEAILGVLSVAAIYWVILKRFGWLAALGAALALAAFPSLVAVSRDNNLDALLILFMILACGLGLAACESGRLPALLACGLGLAACESGRLPALLACGLLCGLAFNTKTLAGLLMVPGIALAYLTCAPGPLVRRVKHLLGAGLVTLIVCASWMAIVELTPASERPYVGGSTNNSEIGLTFGYNGFGRLGGQDGGPGRIKAAKGPQELLLRRERETSEEPSTPAVSPMKPQFLPDGRRRVAIFFGAPTGPLRMFELGLDTQGAWLLPFALFGMIAMALLLALTRPARQGQPGWRRDKRTAALIVLGGWFLTEWLILSFSKGIMHPYYVSALGPGTAAMCGVGLIGFSGLLRGPSTRIRWTGLALLLAAVTTTVAAQLAILHEDNYLHGYPLPLISAAGAGLLAAGLLVLGRPARWAPIPVVLLLCLFLILPGIYSENASEAPVEGVFPEAGPHVAAAEGPYGVSPAALETDREIIRYVQAHDPGSRWELLTQASDGASPLILLGLHAGSIGGYGASDPALNGPELARLVKRGEARYVLIGGTYTDRGGNAASVAVLETCRLVPASRWRGPGARQGELVLFDCRGDEPQLAAAA